MKHRIGAVILGLMLAIGCFTVLSAKNYMQKLTLVTLTSSVPNTIRTELTAIGELYYSEIMNVEIPAGCRVEEIYVETGEHIAAGSPLIRLREVDLQVSYLQKQIQRENLQKSKESNGVEGELACWQLQLLEEELLLWEQWIKDKGILYSTVDGYVINQGYERYNMTTAQSLLDLGVEEGGCYLEWVVEPQAYRLYTGTAIINEEMKELNWSTPMYKNGVYVYQAKLPEVKKCVHGENVQVELRYVSDEYRAVIPKSCIFYDMDGMPYVYEVDTRSFNFGEESYVKKIGVTIEDQDNTNVAIKSPLTNIVLRSSKQLSDMAAVAIVAE